MAEAAFMRLFVCYLLATSFTSLNHDSGNSTRYANITKPIAITDVQGPQFRYRPTGSVILILGDHPEVNWTSPESIWTDMGICAANVTTDNSSCAANILVDISDSVINITVDSSECAANVTFDISGTSTADVCYLADKSVQVCPITNNAPANEPYLRIEATWIFQDLLNAQGPVVDYGMDTRSLLSPMMVNTGYRSRTVFTAILGGLYALYVTRFPSRQTTETKHVNTNLLADFDKACRDFMDKRETAYSAKLAEVKATCNLMYMNAKTEIKYEQMTIQLKLIDTIRAKNASFDLDLMGDHMARHGIHMQDKFFCQAYINRKADKIMREYREMMDIEPQLDMASCKHGRDVVFKARHELDLMRADKVRLSGLETLLKQDMLNLVDASRGESEEMDREMGRIKQHMHIWQTRAHEAARSQDAQMFHFAQDAKVFNFAHHDGFCAV